MHGDNDEEKKPKRIGVFFYKLKVKEVLADCLDMLIHSYRHVKNTKQAMVTVFRSNFVGCGGSCCFHPLDIPLVL